jgi:pantoate--beta-alanine ligase
MQAIQSIAQIRQLVRRWRQSGRTIGFVPTMGNLHQGHLSLVKEAQIKADRVVVSIFVNPTQFAPGEDFLSYPRSLQEDRRKLEGAQVDVLFVPDKDEIYYPDATTSITVSGLSEQYCGASRAGHFSGVATVVCKLLNIVQPDLAVFGQKDFQQLRVIQRMVRDLNIPVKVKTMPTFRGPDGLAMSSRNSYLTPKQKATAPELYQALLAAKDAVLANSLGFTEIEHQQIARLRCSGFDPEYFAICRSQDLRPAKSDDTDLVILVAAKLGKTRLIDNIEFSKDI